MIKLDETMLAYIDNRNNNSSSAVSLVGKRIVGETLAYSNSMLSYYFSNIARKK